MSCTTTKKTVTVHGKRHKVSRRKCTTKLIFGVASFTTTPTRAQLVRGQVVYATGSAWLYGVMLDARRPLMPGHYTLTLRRGAVTTRRPITIP